jgi:hypothetical protein
MAHDPKVKARVVADLLTGVSISKVATKYGISKSTAKAWADEACGQNRTESNANSRSIIERAREETFDQSLEVFLRASINMLITWARECSDPRFIRENPSGVQALGETVLDRAERIMSDLQSEAQTDGAESDGLPRLVPGNDP